MKKSLLVLTVLISSLLPSLLVAQVDEDQVGAWYMYLWNTTVQESPIGFQGDVQYRNWNLVGDLEQLLLRGGVTYAPSGTQTRLTLGYAFVATGEFGDATGTSKESRIYQEALLPQKLGERIFLAHRYRYEQRFVEGQDFRTRYRYNLFVTIPINQPTLKKGAIYLALYNELFINGQREIGTGDQVQIFDRNRTYGALGYGIGDNLRVQLGYMRQINNGYGKGQLQLSLHQTF